jgi:hypothetical protein
VSIFNQEPEDVLPRYEAEPEDPDTGGAWVVMAWLVLTLATFWGATGYFIGRLGGCD